MWCQEAVQTYTFTWPLVVTLIQIPAAAWPQTQTWPSMVEQTENSPWPQESFQATHNGLFLSSPTSHLPICPFICSLYSASLSHLPTPCLHILELCAVGYPWFGLGLWMSSFCPLCMAVDGAKCYSNSKVLNDNSLAKVKHRVIKL